MWDQAAFKNWYYTKISTNLPIHLIVFNIQHYQTYTE